ncbi:MAG: hypothetical protein ACPGN3_18100, partial [Opitutales bacterium]
PCHNSTRLLSIYLKTAPSRGGAFSLYDSNGGLDLTGAFTGTLTNDVTLRTVGDFTIASGASITTTGSGNDITIEADEGAFINNAGASALSADSRFIIYSENNETPHDKGGLTGEEIYEVDLGSDPQGSGNVFYFSDVEPVSENPVSEEPSTEEPSVGAPIEEEPTSEDPAIEEPTNDQPEDVSEVGVPETSTPDDASVVDGEIEGNREASETRVPEIQGSTAPSNLSGETDMALVMPKAPVVSDIPRSFTNSESLSFEFPPEIKEYYDEKLGIEVLSAGAGLQSEETKDTD